MSTESEQANVEFQKQVNDMLDQALGMREELLAVAIGWAAGKIATELLRIGEPAALHNLCANFGAPEGFAALQGDAMAHIKRGLDLALWANTGS